MINDHFGKCIECQWIYFPVNKCAGVILKVRQLALIFSESCWRTCTFGLNQVNEFSFVLSLCLSTNCSAYAPQLSWQESHQEKENCILHKELSSWVFQGSVWREVFSFISFSYGWETVRPLDLFCCIWTPMIWQSFCVHHYK